MAPRNEDHDSFKEKVGRLISSQSMEALDVPLSWEVQDEFNPKPGESDVAWFERVTVLEDTLVVVRASNAESLSSLGQHILVTLFSTARAVLRPDDTGQQG